MNDQTQIHLEIKGSPEIVSFFVPMLSKGFKVCIAPKSSIQDFLCRQIGLKPDYIEERIQTLFVDGKAVDGFSEVVLKSGSVLALSGAMPGLAGATLRRGGFYGRMRGEISHSDHTAPDTCAAGHVTVKLFNLILKETGPLFLRKGVLVQGEDLQHRVNMAPDRFKTEWRSVELDGDALDPVTLMNKAWTGVEVLLQVR